MNTEEIQILKNIFLMVEENEGPIDAVLFRARNGKLINVIDQLVHIGLIQKAGENYRIHLSALETINIQKSVHRLNGCRKVFHYLQESYKENPKRPILISKIASSVNMSTPEMMLSIPYLIDASCLSRWSTTVENPETYEVTPSETTVKYESIDEIIAETKKQSSFEEDESKNSKLESRMGERKKAQPNIFHTTFNAYKVLEVIGEGGSGRVFKVVDDHDNVKALKYLKPEGLTKQKNRRFKNELEFCTKNTHPNILTVLDSGYVETDGVKVPFYVMQHFDNSLRSIMKKRLAADDIWPIFSQILDGVEAAHLKNIIHRDLKPENILYNQEDTQYVVADFGIARFTVEHLHTAVETRNAERLANFLYSAPEQRQPGAEVDHRADIYALGLMLNEMFTANVIQGSGYKVIAQVSDKYAFLDNVIEQMVSQDVGDRPQTIAEIKKQLNANEKQHFSQQKLSTPENIVVPLHEVVDPLIFTPNDLEQTKRTLPVKNEILCDPTHPYSTISVKEDGKLGIHSSTEEQDPIVSGKFYEYKGTYVQISEEDFERLITHIIDPYMARRNDLTSLRTHLTKLHLPEPLIAEAINEYKKRKPAVRF